MERGEENGKWDLKLDLTLRHHGRGIHQGPWTDADSAARLSVV